MSTIEDGSGDSYTAKVDLNKRLHTRSVSLTEHHDSTDLGDSYNINTGVVTLTTANDSAVLYVKNNEEKGLNISAIVVGMGPSTGGSGGIPKITMVRNPTAGTIVSGATAVDISSNRNFGSSNILSADAYKGDGTAMTFTDGTEHIISFQTANGRAFFTVDEILPKTKSIGIKIDPQAGNTSMDVYVALVCYIRGANQ